MNNAIHHEAMSLKVDISPGSSMKKVANDLYQHGIVAHPGYFVWAAKWQGVEHEIKAGEYAITPGMTPAEFLNLVVGGKVVQYAITFVEGWTFRQMLDELNHNENISHELINLSIPDIVARLALDEQHPEGLFLPETYYFNKSTSDIDLLKRANQAMQQFLTDAWQEREQPLPYKNAYEALVMASIVEKETAVEEERKQIAGVFVRRLEKNMRLQTDPTVIYGIGDQFNGNLTRRDLKTDTPYNTYVHKGLPPTPIAMPGRRAILAALHPEPGSSLYFVAKGDGTHQFSDTVEAHNRAVRKYQIYRKNK